MITLLAPGYFEVIYLPVDCCHRFFYYMSEYDLKPSTARTSSYNALKVGLEYLYID